MKTMKPLVLTALTLALAASVARRANRWRAANGRRCWSIMSSRSPRHEGDRQASRLRDRLGFDPLQVRRGVLDRLLDRVLERPGGGGAAATAPQ